MRQDGHAKGDRRIVGGLGDTMATAGLDRCPVCACDLSDNPPPGRCPDCGFEYDAQTRIWRSSQSWARLAGLYASVGLTAGVIISFGYSMGSESVPRPTLPLVLAVACPAMGLLWRKIIGGRVTGRFVALTPAGIVVGTRARPVVVRWLAFGRLTNVRGVPKLERRDHPAPAPLDDVFDTPQELAEFRAALAEAAARHQNVSHEPGNGLHSHPATE